ncbi:MAG: DUF3006 domain-containing protein [Ruminococcus sp.]|nr:DUF3006 domain-containing protein [Ruminococcus sp.]
MIIIDRIDEDTAVLETDEKNIIVECNSLPDNSKEGDVLKFENGCYVIDEEETERRRNIIMERIKNMKKK